MREVIQQWLHDAIETHFSDCPTAGGVEMCEHLAGFVADPQWRDAAGCSPTAWAYEQATKALNAKSVDLEALRGDHRRLNEEHAQLKEVLGLARTEYGGRPLDELTEYDRLRLTANGFQAMHGVLKLTVSRLRADLAAEREKSASLGVARAAVDATVAENERLRAENDRLCRLCSDEHSRERQAMEPDPDAEMRGGHWSIELRDGKPHGVRLHDWSECTEEQCGSDIDLPISHPRHRLAAPVPNIAPAEAEADPPRVWWDPIRGLLLCDRDVDHRLVDQPPAHNGCVALVPATSAQPYTFCTCRPVPNGLDVDQRCPSHGRTA